ncbi:WD repeat-containing protein 74 isoform X2 [Parasteatoda tepidariorum]
MCWESSSQEKVYTGHKNQLIKAYDCDTGIYTTIHDSEIGQGAIKGLCLFNENLVTAVESGVVKVWNEDNPKKVEINTEGNICKMERNFFSQSQIATGGEENDLKVWDLNAFEKAIFMAKNVRNDFLDLRVPVWITDMKFQELNKIVTCTRHHQVRLYDTRAQRRPVIDMEFEKYPLMSLSLAHNENQIVVGSSRGRMALIDLRKKLLVHVFKGFAGSIRCVQCHPTQPLVASCGLDRFLRIHELNQHKLLKKIYLKTKLNTLLYKTNLETTDSATNEPEKSVVPVKPAKNDEEEDDIWSAMPVVKEGKKIKKILNNDMAEPVKKKKKKNI